MRNNEKDPPKADDVKKGRSASRGERPRKAAQRLSAAQLFCKVMNEEVTIEIDGAPVMMTRLEALLRNISIMAHKNASAARLLHRMRLLFPASDGQDVKKSILVLADNEMQF